MVWQTKSSWLVICIVFFMASGCCKSFNQTMKEENAEASTWITGSWAGQYDWIEIAKWRSVTEPRMQLARMRLQSTASVQITSAEAHDLTGETGFDEGARTPYLLRVVSDGRNVFPVELYFRENGDIWVAGGANSKCTVPMRRRPVVAWLGKE